MTGFGAIGTFGRAGEMRADSGEPRQDAAAVAAREGEAE